MKLSATATLSASRGKLDAHPPRSYRLGFDIGGTFTDLILVDEDGRAQTRKVLSSPDDYTASVCAGVAELVTLAAASAESVSYVVHGTTIATNAILERRGARVGLITTDGFRDVLEIGRMRLPRMYDMDYIRPAPLVPRRLRFEVKERISHRGEVLVPLDPASVEAAIDALLEAKVEVIAIALIHAYANPVHEHAIAAAIRQRGADVLVTLSSDIHPEAGEFERTSTVATNAYVMPAMERYLGRLVQRLEQLGVRSAPLIMQSNGGVMSAAGARQHPVLVIESGPAAGVVACAKLARRLGNIDVIGFDVGGTTAKAAVLEGGTFRRVGEFQIGGLVSEGSRLNGGGGFVIRAPAVDLAEIGAGGGSIVSVDAIGSLKIGPRSAGASPGPVCYDRGGERVALTDVNLCLGYLNQERLPSGLPLNAAKARAAFQTQIADRLGLPLLECAYGVYQVGCAITARAVRAVTIERGLDPRKFALIAFGGNGPLFGVALARLLSIQTVIVPSSPGVFSAVGLLEADVERHLSRTLMERLSEIGEDQLAELLDRIAEEAIAALRADGCADAAETACSLDMKYAGQSFHIEIAVPAQVRPHGLKSGLIEALGREHKRLYGFQGNPDAVQIVTLRAVARAVGSGGSTALRAEATRFAKADRSRNAYFGRGVGSVETAVIFRDELSDDFRPGPLLIDEYDSTTLIPPGARTRKDGLGNIVIDVGTER